MVINAVLLKGNLRQFTFAYKRIHIYVATKIFVNFDILRIWTLMNKQPFNT